MGVNCTTRVTWESPWGANRKSQANQENILINKTIKKARRARKKTNKQNTTKRYNKRQKSMNVSKN